MIQRIQSVYLALALICVILLNYFPLFFIDISTDAAKSHAEFGAHGLVAEGILGENLDRAQFPFYYVYVFLSLLTLLALFMYKNRRRQIIFCRISLIFHLLVIAGMYSFYYGGKSFLADTIVIPEGETATITLSLAAGFYLIIATIPLLLLAIRGIRNDEKLVKSLDRLR